MKKVLIRPSHWERGKWEVVTKVGESGVVVYVGSLDNAETIEAAYLATGEYTDETRCDP
jgi:uncharacterized membrane protein YgcG